METRHLSSQILLSTAGALFLWGASTSGAGATEPCGNLGKCKVLIETNASDGDIGFHFLLDGGELVSAEIRDPSGSVIFSEEAEGRLERQTFTETFVESAEPVCRNRLREEPDDTVVTLTQFLRRWAAGTYSFEGKDEDGEILYGETELTYELPATPEDVDFDGSIISWDAGEDLGECASTGQLERLVSSGRLPIHPEDVKVDAWEIVLQPDVDGGDPMGNLVFSIRVPGDIDPKAVTVPAEYLASLPDDTPVKIEVGAIGGEDNATFVEEDGFCANVVEGCQE